MALDDVATWASGVGPEKGLLLQWEAEVDGAVGDAGGRYRGRYVSTGLLERLHSRGLQVHPFTFREEQGFLLDSKRINFPQRDFNLMQEVGLFIGLRPFYAGGPPHQILLLYPS